MGVSNNELIEIIDFLAGRLPIDEDWFLDNRDDIIADVFQLIEDKRNEAKNEEE